MKRLRSSLAAVVLTALSASAERSAPLSYAVTPGGATNATAVSLSLVCKEPSATSDLTTAGSMLIDGKPFDLVESRSASPAEMPVHLVILVPGDTTLRNSHQVLMTNLGGLPGVQASLGHRAHSVSAFAWSGCSPTRLVARIASSDGAAPGEFQDALSSLRQESGPAGAPCPIVDPSRVLRDFATSYGASIRDDAHGRPIVLIALFDGLRDPRAQPASSTDAASTVEQLRSVFESTVLVQPDVAPAWLANPRNVARILDRRALGEIVRRRLATEQLQACKELERASPGDVDCASAEWRERMAGIVTNKLNEAQNVLADNPLAKGAQLVTRDSLVTLYAESTPTPWAAAASRINDLVPRGTELDCLGAELVSRNAGRLVALGGVKGMLLKCGSGEVSTANTLVAAAAQGVPFFYGKTLVACARDGLGAAVIPEDAPLTVRGTSAGQSFDCFTGKMGGARRDPMPVELASKLCPAVAVAPPTLVERASVPGLVGAGVLVGVVVLVLLLRRPSTQRRSSTTTGL